MRFTAVILGALLCVSAYAAENATPDSDDAIVAAAEKLVNENASKAESPSTAVAVSATAETPSLANEVKKESEIPLFNKTEKVSKSENSVMGRLAASLAFIVVVGGILIFASRRWGRQKNKGGETARIEILHQFHMGPRKSLALIRVAGEAILIGCTDQNINLIKSVTLIDDELEGVLGKDFNNFLEDDFSIEDMRKALTPRA